MLIVTAKVPKRKLAFGVALAAMACCCALVLNLGTSAVREVASPSVPDPKGVKTNEDRVAYLADFGWQVSPEPIATQEMLIPKEMDESYNEYLALQSGQVDILIIPTGEQSGQGFDLEKYAGKRAKRYTYEITNYPTGEAGVQVNLLIYKNTVIAGEVLSPQLDGFLHGLAMP